jgi:TaqI-like C-terminal specificity domain
MKNPYGKNSNPVSQRLGDVTTHIFQGLKTGADGIFIGDVTASHNISERVRFETGQDTVEIEKQLLRPLIKGGHMRRYLVEPTTKRILFPYEDGKLIPANRLRDDFPKAWKYLQSQKSRLEAREDGKMVGQCWYAYTRNQALTTMYSTKIVTPDYYAHASYCFDPTGEFFFCGGGAGGYGILAKDGHNPKFLLGLLNSKLLDWYLHKISLRAYQTAYMYVKKYIEKLPIVSMKFFNRTDKARHDRMVELVEQMLALRKQLAAAKTAHMKTNIHRQIDEADAQIDKLVYDLYRLSADEIKIVEAAR